MAEKPIEETIRTAFESRKAFKEAYRKMRSLPYGSSERIMLSIACNSIYGTLNEK